MAEAGTRARPAVDKMALWNRELLDELLPVQNEPGIPVVLACDDETLRAVGERLSYDATEATRRAVEGYDEETRDADGKVIRSVRCFDSALLQQQLKARRPSVYRENAVEVNTPAVCVLDSSFNRDRGIEPAQAKPSLALRSGEKQDE